MISYLIICLIIAYIQARIGTGDLKNKRGVQYTWDLFLNVFGFVLTYSEIKINLTLVGMF
jgi:hypothetical protein